jgi:predicted transcriptional regulator
VLIQSATKIQVPLEEEEIETIISILNFANTACPVSDINEHLRIDHGMIQRIIEKMLESISLNEKKPDDLSKGVKLNY